MIFVILGIAVLFISFIIALVTLAREQSRLNADHLKPPNHGKINEDTLAGKTILAKRAPKNFEDDDRSRKIREELEAKIAQETERQKSALQEKSLVKQPFSETKKAEFGETDSADLKPGSEGIGTDYVPLPWNMPNDDADAGDDDEEEELKLAQKPPGNLQGEFKIKRDKPGEVT